MLTASVFWNRVDITVSSLCGLQLRRRAAGKGFQRGLAKLGDALEWLNPGHCEAAIRADFARMQSAAGLMEYYLDDNKEKRSLVLI